MATFQMLDEGNSEAQDRLATSFFLAQTSAGLARTGVLSGLVVTQTTTASGAVLVAAGAAPVQASVGTGVALLVNDTLATLDVFTAHPVGALPRNDIVAFDSVTKALIAIIGTPNATPTDPTVPATACALARLRHAASATTIPTAKIDQLGLTLRRPFAEYVTTVTCVPDGSFNGTFPAGLFTVPPILQCTAQSTTQFAVACAAASSTTTFSGHCGYFLNGAGGLSWIDGFTIAIRANQMTATSAAG